MLYGMYVCLLPCLALPCWAGLGSRLDVYLEFSLSHPAIRIEFELSNPFAEIGLVISEIVVPVFNGIKEEGNAPVAMGFLTTPIVLAPGAVNQSSTIVVRVTDSDIVHAKPTPPLDIRHGSFKVQIGEMHAPSAAAAAATATGAAANKATTAAAAEVGKNSLTIFQLFSLADMTRKNNNHCG